MCLLVDLPVHDYHQSVFLKRLPIRQYIFGHQAGSTSLGDASFVYPRDRRCGLCFTSGFHFIFGCILTLLPRGWVSYAIIISIIIIIVIIIIIIIIIIITISVIIIFIFYFLYFILFIYLFIFFFHILSC